MTDSSESSLKNKNASKPSSRMWLWWFFPLLTLWSVWCVGQIFRDRVWPLELAFYVPSAGLMAGLLIIGLWAAWHRRRRMAICALLMAIGPAVFVLGVENRFFAAPPVVPDGRPIRLVHWNVMNGLLGQDAIQDILCQEKADLYVLSEPDRIDLDALSRRLGDSYKVISGFRFAAVAPGRLHNGVLLCTEGGLLVYSFDWTNDDRTCKVFVVDLDSTLLLPRDERLGRLIELIEEHRPDLVVGDFNAPRRCLALCSLPDGYAHAYNTAGSGWSYTWPMPFPVYAIDQCIAGPRIKPIRYQLKSSPRSDHRRQVFDFVVGDSDSGTP